MTAYWVEDPIEIGQTFAPKIEVGKRPDSNLVWVVQSDRDHYLNEVVVEENIMDKIANIFNPWILIGEKQPDIEVPVYTVYSTPYGISSVVIRCLLKTGMWYDMSTGSLVDPKNITHWQKIIYPEVSE